MFCNGGQTEQRMVCVSLWAGLGCGGSGADYGMDKFLLGETTEGAPAPL